jgi:type I restriction enzyme, S subunit
MKGGWKMKNLGDLCQVIGGGTPSKDKAKYYSGDIPWATVRDMRSEVITETECKITKEAVKSSATNIIPKGNVVIATRVGLGKVCLLGQDTAINQDLRGIVPIDPKVLSVRFLFWWLKSIAGTIVAEGTGATVQGVKLPFVKSLQAPVPPLPEQRRIVGILDAAFDGIAKASANAEKNLQNARALFESHLQSVFTKHGDGWVQKPLSELCDIRHGFAFDGAEFSKNVPEGKPFIITPGNFTEDGKLLFNEKNTKRFSGKQPSGFRFDVGDLVVVMTDLSSKMKILGKPAFVETDDVLHNQRIGRVIFLNDRIEKRLLYYFMMSEDFLKSIKESSTGTMVKHTAPKRILRNVISFPVDRKKQRAIISKLDDLRAETQRLESLYQRKLAALNALKKSLLHQAFTGRL